MPEAIPMVRAECSELGLGVEASTDGGKTWVGVQLPRYKERKSNGTRPYGTFIDPALDRAEYFQELDRRGVQYRRVS